jgi:hypothetical protein
MATKRERYLVRCQCGEIGTGYWQENDGARYLRRGPETVVEVTGNFDWKEPASGPGSFFGRRLAGRTCGLAPATQPCNSKAYYDAGGK